MPSHVRALALQPGDVVLVDEAGMAGTFLLDQLVQLAATRGAVVRLLGDDRQLPAVESGGALRLIAAQPGTPELSVLHRFRDPAEAFATLKLRTGDGTAVDWYAAHGRIRAGSAEAMAEVAHAGWRADMLAGKVTLMAAAHAASVARLSARARADRVAAGQVEARGVLLHDGNLAGRGDWVTTRRNERRLSALGGRDWVKNGDGWQVKRRHRDGSLTVRHLAHSGRVRLPAGYVAAHVEPLYATTTHRAQGATVDTVHPLITAGMTRENLYVLASRAREKTTFYVATHDQSFDEDAHVDKVRSDPRQYDAREILLAIVATEGAPLSATEAITTAQEEAGSVATLVPRYLYAVEHRDAARRYAAAAVTALGLEDGTAITTDPAWGAVTRRLYDTEADGWDSTRLLAVAAAQRELGTADSLAEALSWRLDGHLARHPGPPAGPIHEADDPATPGTPPAAGRLLPWVASPRPAPDGDRYLTEAASLIKARVADLADAAVRHRPPWMLPLGRPPEAPEAEREWRHHVAVIAAYRDQHRVATDDPRQVLGPYVEAGRAAHKAYWHAAESVLGARRLAGLDPARYPSGPDAAARTRLAAGIYRTLPEHEPAAISGEMAERLGDLWFGNRAAPDEDAATQPAYSATLTATLARRGYLATAAQPVGNRGREEEPLEATLARRPRLTPSRPGRTRQRAPEPAPAPRLDPQPRPAQQPARAPEPS